jgi:hypothetical protein
MGFDPEDSSYIFTKEDLEDMITELFIIEDFLVVLGEYIKVSQLPPIFRKTYLNYYPSYFGHLIATFRSGFSFEEETLPSLKESPSLAGVSAINPPAPYSHPNTASLP